MPQGDSTLPQALRPQTHQPTAAQLHSQPVCESQMEAPGMCRITVGCTNRACSAHRGADNDIQTAGAGNPTAAALAARGCRRCSTQLAGPPAPTTPTIQLRAHPCRKKSAQLPTCAASPGACTLPGAPAQALHATRKAHMQATCLAQAGRGLTLQRVCSLSRLLVPTRNSPVTLLMRPAPVYALQLINTNAN